MSIDSPTAMAGLPEGPGQTEAYKRAVYRDAPLKFSIEMLTPTKIGSNYRFGMRISSLTEGNRLSTATAHSTPADYDIWRKWEDCLTFQCSLELEYRRLAISKRTRLQRGKGIRRNGFYKQDAASSWESLPPGPDPNSVAHDIHKYIPALNRKGTIFRVSQATVNQRFEELKAFLDALWKDDAPALIDEMRNDALVRDFFGYWRRDHEIAEKQLKQRAAYMGSRTSVTSSIFSTYFSASNASIQSLQDGFSRSLAPSRSTFTPSSRDLEPPRYRKGSTSSSERSPSPSGRKRAYSGSSFTSSPSTVSDSSLDSPVQANVSIPAIAENSPVFSFNHNPSHHAHHAYERPSSPLSVLQEERISLHLPATSEKKRKSSLDPDRHGRIFLSPPDVPSSPTNEGHLHNEMRQSWQTIDSSSCILEGLEHLTLPSSPSSDKNRAYRDSIASVATCMTDATMDGVLPHNKLPPPKPQKFNRKSRIVSGPVSISEFDNEFFESDDSDEVLDMFLTTDSFPMPCADIPRIEFPEVLVDPAEDCPVTPSISEFSHDGQLTPLICVRPPLSPPKSTTFSSKTMTPIPDQFTIKAKYNDSLIILRVPDEISYKDLRQRLFNKLVGQEGIALSDKFQITFLQPVNKAPTTHNSTISSRPSSFDAEEHLPYSVTSADDWENVAASVQGYKLTLLITDNSP
ncbi:hypothetical protein H0H93_000183 [Arthromyces matolae]|nr:hypothetical protein H0H93_000183 [Arthromyces matolae]